MEFGSSNVHADFNLAGVASLFNSGIDQLKGCIYQLQVNKYFKTILQLVNQRVMMYLLCFREYLEQNHLHHPQQWHQDQMIGESLSSSGGKPQNPYA